LLRRQDNQKPDSEETYENGVTIIDPDSTYIDEDVEIGIDTVVTLQQLLKERQK